MPKNSLRVHEVGAGLRSLDIFQFDITLREKLVAHPFATGYRNTSDDDLLIAVLEGDNRVNDKNEFIPPAKVGLITHLGAGEHLSHGGWNALKLKPVTVTIAVVTMARAAKFSATDDKFYLVMLHPLDDTGADWVMLGDLDIIVPFQDIAKKHERSSTLLQATATATAFVEFVLEGDEILSTSGDNVKVYEIVPWGMNELAVII